MLANSLSADGAFINSCARSTVAREPSTSPVEPMVDLPESFYLLVNYPSLIAIPIVLFAALALWSHSVTAWVATAAWNLYLIYELGMKAEEFCSGTACIKRTPLYVVYPLLGILSLVAVVQVYVHIRDKRDRGPLH
jgi:hypothetical protein